MIPQSFIDDLLERSDIVALVGTRVELKKAGKDFQGLCPFHSEKSPSFTVSASKQFYHCFGCGAHGNAIGFVVEYEGYGFRDAVQMLASQCGMTVPDEAIQSPAQLERGTRDAHLLDAMRAARAFFLNNLKSRPDAVDYMKRRGLQRKTVLDFGIGFADDRLLSALSSFGNDVLLEAGLVVRDEDTGEVYDKFRSRVMFPICSEKGDVIGFGGRVITEHAKPKYLNSPETPIFIKGKELFGLNLARTAIRQSRTAVLLEGYMDVAMVRQHGDERVVAALGTSVTEEQIARLFRMCDEIVFCFDGDAAGQKAAARAARVVLGEIGDGKSAKFLRLPVGHDPDSFVSEFGVEAWRDAIEADAVPLSVKITEVLIAGRDIELPEVKALVAKEAESVCGSITKAPRFKEALVARFEKVTGVRLRMVKAKPSPASEVPVSVEKVSVSAQVAHYEVYRRLATMCAISPDDGADIAASGIDVFADLIVSWFATFGPANAGTDLREQAQAIGDVTLRGFVVDAIARLHGRWMVRDAAAWDNEREAARTGLIAEIERVKRARSAAEFLD